jgi:uncharacterized membrane protein YedE/YeeE
MEKPKEMYNIIFKEDWPMWAGGILLAILAILMWMLGEPWAMIGGYRNWGDWFLTGIGVYEAKEMLSPLIDTKSIMALGIVFGAFIASLITGGFGFRMPPWWELLKGLVGGALMGFSSVIAGGCNIGGFYSQFAALSLSGIFMWAGLIIGAILGLRYIKWELEHIPSKVLSAGINLPSAPFVFRKSLPFFGWILLILIFFMPIFYGENTKLGILATISLLAGFVMMRSRFCFASTFRDPFMTGESDKTQAVILSILVLVLGVSIIKWSGIVPSYKYVFSNAGWGGVVGGAIFGFGMLLAGG